MATNPFLPLIHYQNRYWFSGPLWAEVTNTHKYQDANRSYNELSDAPAVEWELIYEFDKQDPDHLAAMAIFDAHYYDRRISRPFTFTTKEGFQIPDCYYERYEPNHEGHKSRRQARRITIRCNAYLPPDAPSVPVLSGYPNSDTDFYLTWTPSIDNVAVTSYEIRANSSFIINVGLPSPLEYYFGVNEQGVPYDFEVRALDADGHTSQWSNVLTLMIDPPVSTDNLLAANGEPLTDPTGEPYTGT